MATEILKVLVYAIIAYFISTIVHEMGHVTCGLLNKWRFWLLVVGPFKLYREDMNLKIRFGLEKDLTLWGGCGGTFPEKEDETAIETFAKILLAGPLASFILGVVFMIIFAFSKSELTLMIGMIGIAEGIACILPMNIKTGILYNDGSRFKRIVKGGKERDEENALLSIVIKTMLYGDKAVFEEEKLDILKCSDDVDLKYYGLFYSFLNAKGRKDEAAMERIRLEAAPLKAKASKYTVLVCAME